MSRGAALRIPWLKVLGVAFVALALRLALDPDYPVPRQAPTPAPAAPALEPLPELLEPLGEVTAWPPFRWRFAGPRRAWRVHVLDAEWHELVAVEGGDACEWQGAAEALRDVPPGATCHWLVAAVDGSTRSAPALVRR